MSYTLQWRNLTPGGNVGRVEFKQGLTLDDINALLPSVTAKACWIYIQRDDIDFKGNSIRRVKKK